MLFISCRWSKVTGYNCILHDWLYELQRREITGPLSPSVGICVCACTHFCTGCSEQQSIVISLLCSCTTLLGFFFFFLFGIVGFISEDNMKPPQSIFKKNPKSTMACLFKACCYCAIFITAATPLSTCTSWIQLVQLYSLRRRCPRLWKGVRKLSSAHKSYWFFFNFHLCFSFFSFVLRVNLTFSGFW